jgi:hypothetical protein
MLFYDQACGNAYIATESDFPYRPSALFVMDGLIQACVAIRDRIDAKLEENARSRRILPAVDEEINDTEVGKYLARLSGISSLNAFDELLGKADSSANTINDLKSKEVRLRGADTTNERQKLIRHAAKLDSLKSHLENLEGALGDDAITLLQGERNRVLVLTEAADLLAKTFESEPLPGVGSPPWKELWESARRFSQLLAYPGGAFPVVTEGASCVLCQQPLAPEASERLSRFERFVQDDTQTRLQDARASWDAQVARLANLPTTPEAIDTHLKDLEADEAKLMHDVKVLIERYEIARAAVVDVLSGASDLPLSGVKAIGTRSRLETAAAAAIRPRIINRT